MELIPHCFVEQKLYIMVLIHVMNLDIDVEVETENQNLDKETDYTGPQPPVDSEWSETEWYDCRTEVPNFLINPEIRILSGYFNKPIQCGLNFLLDF